MTFIRFAASQMQFAYHSRLPPDEATHELHPSTCSLLLLMLSFLLSYLLLSSPSLLCSGQQWHVKPTEDFKVIIIAIRTCDALMSEDCKIIYFDIRVVHSSCFEADFDLIST